MNFIDSLKRNIGNYIRKRRITNGAKENHGYSADLLPKLWSRADEIFTVEIPSEKATPQRRVAINGNYPFQLSEHQAFATPTIALYKNANLLVRNRNVVAYDCYGTIIWPTVAPVENGVFAVLDDQFLLGVGKSQQSGHLTDCFLLSGFRDYNYYHWTIDTLCQLPSYFSIFGFGKGPKCALQNDVKPYVSPSLTAAGLDADQIDLLKPGTYHVENLYIPSNVRQSARSPFSGSLEMHRQAILSQINLGNRGPRKIYVSRPSCSGAKRAVINDAELGCELAERGFVVIDPGEKDFESQVRLFQNAEIIVGAHGAGLTNLVYAPAHCSIIEIFNPNKVLPFYFNLCQILGFAHYSVVGESAGSGRDGAFSAPIRETLKALDNALEKY